MKIKLPRRRKKAYIRYHSAENYRATIVINDELFKLKPIKFSKGFPRYILKGAIDPLSRIYQWW